MKRVNVILCLMFVSILGLIGCGEEVDEITLKQSATQKNTANSHEHSDDAWE